MNETINCVRCGKPATNWTGHVLKPDKSHVIAGWCDHCVNSKGFSGHWSQDMGERLNVMTDDTVFHTVSRL